MQTNELKEQLAQPSYRLFADDGAGVDLSRDVGQSIGGHIFTGDDPNRIINSLINMEAYFHHLRMAGLQALKQQLINGYENLASIVHDNEEVQVTLLDGTVLALPGHTAPALNELLARLQPIEGYDNPRLCLELIQQASRLMLVLGMPKLILRGNKNQQ